MCPLCACKLFVNKASGNVFTIFAGFSHTIDTTIDLLFLYIFVQFCDYKINMANSGDIKMLA